ncbi:acyl-CoA thioester hydrolase/BAAT C-terminal domain-containing protein [Hymenobacter algoricola]|uniref:BAAT/Acyl-CoA thioester hydrolase C-terminal domain-containing protein n=1 Tax=Hymenobacter algoricola TaxID=486267 RepID=A0ABP7NFF9_9BACT
MRHLLLSLALFLGVLLTAASAATAQIDLKTPGAQSLLYVGPGRHQPLLVGLGGSEGGNAWASHHWQPTRDQLVANGYAFLALGYFKTPDAPPLLDRISLDTVYAAIKAATRHPQVDGRKIALVGGSRGADLALLLASRYPDIQCVVSIVGSYVVFPGNTNHLTTSAWSYRGQPLPFVPVNEAAVPFLVKGDLRATFAAMLTDTAAVRQARIPVENIRGAVLLISATQDEVCPSTPMAEQMLAQLKRASLRYPRQHLAIVGGHAEPLKHFDAVIRFLHTNFPAR